MSRSEKTGKNWNRATNRSGYIPPKWFFLGKSHQKIWLGGKEGMPDVSRFEKTAEIRDRDTNCVELRRSAAINDRSQPVFACTTHFPPSPTHYRRFAAPFGVRNPSIGIVVSASLTSSMSMGISPENPALQTCDAQNGQFQKADFAQNGRFRCRILRLLPPVTATEKTGRREAQKARKDAKEGMKKPTRGKGNPGGQERKRRNQKRLTWRPPSSCRRRTCRRSSA